MSDTEQRSVDLAELKAGVRLRAGYKVVLIVNGAQGSTRRKPLRDPRSDGPEAAVDGGPVDGGPELPKRAGALENLRWGASSATDGDEVEMVADGTDGASVLFTVERREGPGRQWQSMGSVKTTVDGGVARAKARIEHSGKLDGVHYRFRATLL